MTLVQSKKTHQLWGSLELSELDYSVCIFLCHAGEQPSSVSTRDPHSSGLSYKCSFLLVSQLFMKLSIEEACSFCPFPSFSPRLFSVWAGSWICWIEMVPPASCSSGSAPHRSITQRLLKVSCRDTVLCQRMSRELSLPTGVGNTFWWQRNPMRQSLSR